MTYALSGNSPVGSSREGSSSSLEMSDPDEPIGRYGMANILKNMVINQYPTRCYNHRTTALAVGGTLLLAIKVTLAFAAGMAFLATPVSWAVFGAGILGLFVGMTIAYCIRNKKFSVLEIGKNFGKILLAPAVGIVGFVYFVGSFLFGGGSSLIESFVSFAEQSSSSNRRRSLSQNLRNLEVRFNEEDQELDIRL